MTHSESTNTDRHPEPVHPSQLSPERRKQALENQAFAKRFAKAALENLQRASMRPEPPKQPLTAAEKAKRLKEIAAYERARLPCGV